MNDYTKMAMDMVKAQASVRTMTSEEMITMVKTLSLELETIAEGQQAPEATSDNETRVAGSGKKSIKENSIVCMECGKTFKLITKKHLLLHNLTPEEYRVKYEIKKGTALASKSLIRDRKKKMQEMELWKRRGAAANTK